MGIGIEGGTEFYVVSIVGLFVGWSADKGP